MTDWSLGVAILSLAIAAAALIISLKAFNIETEPALLLDCRFTTPRALPEPRQIWMLFLAPNNKSNYFDIPNVVPTYTEDGLDYKSPLPLHLFECSLTNHGRTPVLNVAIVFSVQFGAEQNVSLSAPSESARVEVSGLAPKESRHFLIRNASDQYVRIHAPQVAMVETPSKRKAFETRLFTNGWTRGMSSSALPPAPLLRPTLSPTP